MKPGTMKTGARKPETLVKALAAVSPINLSKPALRGCVGGEGRTTRIELTRR